MGQMVTTTVLDRSARYTERELLVLFEIGSDTIDSASSFVGYMCDAYGISESLLWYVLNGLKRKGLLDFASRENPRRGLALTPIGLRSLREVEPVRRGTIQTFSQAPAGRWSGPRGSRQYAIAMARA